MYKATPGLKEFLLVEGRTVAWLGRRVGVSRQWMSAVVNGKEVVSGERASEISGLLGVDRDAVFADGLRGTDNGTLA